MEWKKMNKKQQQTLMRLGGLAVLGIALLLAGGKEVPEVSNQLDMEQTGFITAAVAENDITALEQQLAHTLSCIQDAGAVTVQITVDNLGRKEYACDKQTTERSSREGSGEGKQQTTETQKSETIVQQNGSGPLLLEETMPEICGVLIVASGAKQAHVQEQLLQAAATVLQLSEEKIIVLPGQEERVNG